MNGANCSCTTDNSVKQLVNVLCGILMGQAFAELPVSRMLGNP
jgi:hypothetical protein